MARKAGQTLMVHNHDIEFETVFGDQTVFDILMANTDPRNVVFQLDLYWATNGGGLDNPLDVIERYGNRIQLFHVKDMAAGPFPGRIEIVGEGIIDFPSIFAAAGGSIEVLRRRARPALRRPDVRPVRGRPEGLRLPRLRRRSEPLPAAGRPLARPPHVPFPADPKEDHVRTARALAALAGALAVCAIPSVAVGPGAAARLAVPEGRDRRDPG